MKFWSCIIRAKAAPLRWPGKCAAVSTPCRTCRPGCAPWPPISHDRRAAGSSGPRRGPSLRHARRSDRVRRAHSRQPHALRQHGGAAEVLSRTAPARCGSPVRWWTSPRRSSPRPRPCTAARKRRCISMMLPLLHHGMYLVGLPYTENAPHRDAEPAARRTGRATWPVRAARACWPTPSASSPRRSARASPCSPSRLQRERVSARRATHGARPSGSGSRVAASLLGWYAAGYPWPLCALAALRCSRRCRGLIRGRRYTYAWATLFAIPYLDFVDHRDCWPTRRRGGWPR